MPDKYGRYKAPQSGDLPKHGKHILAVVYSKERRSGMGKERSAKIAWASVERAGYKKTDGWHKVK